MGEIIKNSIIKFDLPFMINLPDDNYTVTFNEVSAIVTLIRAKQKKGAPNGISFPGDSYILGDRWGRFNYSKLVVQFTHLIYIRTHVLLPNYLQELSVKTINRILDVCRGIKGDHYERINRLDIFSYNINYIDVKGNLLPESVFGLVNDNIVATGRYSKSYCSSGTTNKKCLRK
jgi:hypothetical protein